MSKEQNFALECPGCNNRIFYTEFHKCSNATGLLAIKVPKSVKEPKKRKRRRNEEAVDLRDGEEV